jgi:hypothetical protein
MPARITQSYGNGSFYIRRKRNCRTYGTPMQERSIATNLSSRWDLSHETTGWKPVAIDILFAAFQNLIRSDIGCSNFSGGSGGYFNCASSTLNSITGAILSYKI